MIPSGSVLKEGGSLALGEGQLGLFSVEDTTKDGLTAFADLKGQPKDKRFVLKAGRGSDDRSRTGNDKNYSTPQFRIDEVVNLKVSTPQRSEMSVDEVIIGYNGIDPQTGIRLERGTLIPVCLKLTGNRLGMNGDGNLSVEVTDYIVADPCLPVNPNLPTCPSHDPCEPCDPCAPVSCVKPVSECIERLRSKRLFGMARLDEFVEITPVNGCNTTELPSLTPVKTWCLEVCDTGDREALSLLQAQYPGKKVVRIDRRDSVSRYQVISGVKPPDFQQKIASVLKGCEACPDSWTAVSGGILYAVSVEDEGADLSSDIETLPGAVAGTAVKAGGQFSGAGFYTVVLDSRLSKDQIADFTESYPTVTLRHLGKTNDICRNSTVATVSWTLCGTCYTDTREFTLDLHDDKCGQNRLEELRLFYPELTVELEGTAGGCSTRYKTSMITNAVCSECDPVFQDFFSADPPAPYDGNEWKAVETEETPSENECLCGIRFKAKTMLIDPGQSMTDQIAYEEDSIRIQVSAGYADMLPVENFPVFDSPLSVYWVSKWAPRTHVAGYMRDDERMSHAYFTGQSMHDTPFARTMLNEDSLLPDGQAQVVDFELVIRPARVTAIAQKTADLISFHVITRLGYEKDVETLLNSIAAAAGITPVKALP
jgi:hypothetical protein